MRVEDRPPSGQLVDRLDDLAVADDAERVGAGAHLAERLHMDQVAVVAEQVAGAVGDRADDRDPARSGASGRIPSFSTSTSERSASVARRAPRRRRARRAPPAAAASTYGRSKSPSRNFIRRTRPTVASSSASSTRPSASAAESGAPKAAVRGSSASTPAPSARRAAVAEVRREAVGVDEHLDADVVRGDDPVEPPLVAEDRRQQLARGVARARRRRRSRPA